MKKTMAGGIGRWMWIAAFAILPAAQTAAQDASPDAAIRRLETELRTVQIELLQCRMEIQSGKVSWLERELVQAAEEKQRLERSEHLLSLEVRQVEQRLTEELDADERAELEAQRSEALGKRILHARSSLDAAGRRQAAIGSQLQAEQLQLQSLWQRAVALAKAQTPRP